MSWEEACGRASQALEGTGSRGSEETMKKSYDKMEQVFKRTGKAPVFIVED
jgi:hypothetical protein